MSVRGKYIVGIGKGALFVSMPEYKKQFQKKLGFEPFPGTFNIEVDEKSVQKIRAILKSKKTIHIEGFEKNGKKYGTGLCYPSKIQSFDCFLVIPEKTTHPPKILEFLAPVELRKVLRVNPGEMINFELV